MLFKISISFQNKHYSDCIKFLFFQRTMLLISFAIKHPLNRYWVPNSTKTEEWAKGLFPLFMASWLRILLLIHYWWILSTLKVLNTIKTSKIFFQKPPTYLKHQIDASCGNFGMNGFPKIRNNILTELLTLTDDWFQSCV